MYDEKALADSGFVRKQSSSWTGKAASKRESGKAVVEILPGSTLGTAKVFQPTAVGDSALC